MIALRERLLAVPRWPGFPGVDAIDARAAALAAELDDVTLDVIGHSRAGSPLTMLTVGRGTRHALVIGMPHPNEPTGALAALWLAEELARDGELRNELGLVWHFLPCADPDGTRLNEGWFAGPYDLGSYAAHVYRPPMDEQFEWTFHRADLAEPGLPSTPESRAAMAVIDALRPELVVSMHNCEDGGFYAYTSDKRADLTEAMETISEVATIPLEHGHPEAPGDVLGRGLFHTPANLNGGPLLCSTDYAGQYGALGVTVEPPLWVDPRAEDERRIHTSPATAIESARGEVRSRHERWLATMRHHIDLDSARGRAVLADAEHLAADWPSLDFATIAEAASWERLVDLERRRAAGHVIVLLKSREQLSSPLRAVLDDASSALAGYALGSRGYAFVGLDRAVVCHVGVVLAAAASLAGG